MAASCVCPDVTEYVPFQILTAAELNASIDGLGTAVAAVASSVTAETTRAETAESTLTTGIASEVARALAAELLLVMRVSSIAALRAATTSATPNSTVYVVGYHTGADDGGGTFWYNASDTTSSDNGGTIIVDASSRRWYRGIIGPISVKWFGATGDGTTDDAPPVQAAINYCVGTHRALYIPAAAVYYLINTPLNLSNISNLLIYGDGAQGYPESMAIGQSTLAINTGHVGIDATGAFGLFLRDLNIGSLGLSNASTVGLVMGNSTSSTGIGFNLGIENVTISMKGNGSSVPFYGVNVNCLNIVKLSTAGDFGIVMLNSNALSIALPYGTYGPDIQSDQNCSSGCVLYGYGTQAPLWLSNCNGGTHTQMYIHADNIGAGYTGTPYATLIDTCSDLDIHIGIDGFMTAVLQQGAWHDVSLRGTMFQGGTPVAGGQPFLVSFQGTSLKNCDFAIRGLDAYPSNYWYASNFTPTEVSFSGCSFIFDTAISSLVASFDFTGTAAIPIFNCYMNGNSDTFTNTLDINGTPISTSAYRLFINGIRTGTA